MDEEMVSLSCEILNTVIRFIEHGDVNIIKDQEIWNYFTMCHQVEIYHVKFRAKGFYLAYDPRKGAYLANTAKHTMIYDLGLLADRLLDKFCRQVHRNFQLSPAVKTYVDIYGASRFTRFLQVMAMTKEAFNLETVMGRAVENGTNLEGPVFMECLESIALGPRGISRVKDIINEFCIEDVSAETLVDMLATEHQEAVFLAEIKHTILEKLEKKFSAHPKARMWLLMVCSINVIHAVNSFLPFMNFFLKLVHSLSDSITFDQIENRYYSPPGHLTFDNLVHIVAKFYRNPRTTQDIINFIFNQFSVDPTVWGSVLSACHNHPKEDSTADKYYDSLYRKELTDPNISADSLQRCISAILRADHLQMAAALGLTSCTGTNVKSELPQQPADPLCVCCCPDANSMNAPELDPKPTNMAESPLKVPELPPNTEIVVTKMFRTQNALQRTPSNKWALQRRPLSSRTKRFPKRMNDFWA